MNYYNDNDPKACAWSRELIADGLIPPGHVDERSICDVQGSDLAGYEQCHFFAGIGGWPLALQLAGWVGPVWTGSCPCQPYSAAGKNKGNADARNLWPEFFRLIRERRPVTVFGEQVENAVSHGWLDGISADMEGEGYAVGSVVLGAHSVGAPHIRQRLYWVADASRERWNGQHALLREETRGWESGDIPEAAGCRHAFGMADTRSFAQRGHNEPRINHEAGGGVQVGRAGETSVESTGSGSTGGLEHPPRNGRDERRSEPGGRGIAGGCGDGQVFWSTSRFSDCLDGKARRIPLEPSLFPLAHGVPGRVGLLRGAGNAIVPQVAAAFIAAYMECRALPKTGGRG